MADDFEQRITAAYVTGSPSLEFGAVVQGDKTYPGAVVRLALEMVNRHGLVAGATGTGKTKTLQVLTEELSDAGVPVFLVDIKGDISGLGAPGVVNDHITSRLTQIGLTDWAPRAYPVEFQTLDQGGQGIRLRANVSSFGPILLAKVLGLNETQESVLSLVFKYADDNQLPLVNLADLQATLNYLNGPAGQAALAEYGGISPASVGVMLRNIVQLQEQGADAFFGAPEFDIDDLIRTTSDGRGVVSILEVADMQDRPALFSTFMMWLLAAVYHHLPEVGDPDKPKLVFFLDEAHLLFENSNQSFLDQIEMVARLIRSKGVGVYFVTQSPEDVPPKVLAQLGNRVQHALRAFTPDDQKMITDTARTFPTTTDYDVARELVSLGIGEGLITVLSPRGIPTPTVHVMLRPPRSLMAQIDPAAFSAIVNGSALVAKYGTDQDPQSAKEILTARLAAAQAAAGQSADQALGQITPPGMPQGANGPGYGGSVGRSSGGGSRSTKQASGFDLEDAAKLGTRVLTSSTTNTIVRGLFGILAGGKK
jgi:uncharacterized protein